ncbi:MAG: DUF1015 family protein [Clostridia bacterium]|jgi:uncharacterized protein (DUF1015 family)|nr:DUF1015 family protein [Clostridia bacterium]MCI1999649.1 DUF1015 family protein [Clostridia bacterium]MCI2013972.1 DUF1015 family protein [Clostridia bacterium]
MAVIKPFMAVRPKDELVKQVASLPYDVLSSDEAKHAVESNPYSFLHVGKAEIDTNDTSGNNIYKKASENLKYMIDTGILVKENKPCLYAYRLIRNGHVQTGIAACTSIDEYLNGTIKKHELTRTEKENERLKYIEYCSAQTGPIYLTYAPNENIKEITEKITQANPLYDFTSFGNVRHTVWKIDDVKTINELVKNFKHVKNLYIADGHHRNAAAAKYAIERRNYGDSDNEYNYCMSVLFPSDELEVLEYNRLVKDLNGLDTDSFFEKLSEKFYICPLNTDKPFHPLMPHQFGMFLDGKRYMLTAAEGTVPNDTIGGLDVSILQDCVFEPILGITDTRNDSRISFMGGVRSLEELEKKALTENYRLAFSLYPPEIKDIKEIADEGKTVPPKSTWFEPKLLSGLFVHIV